MGFVGSSALVWSSRNPDSPLGMLWGGDVGDSWQPSCRWCANGIPSYQDCGHLPEEPVALEAMAPVCCLLGEEAAPCRAQGPSLEGDPPGLDGGVARSLSLPDGAWISAVGLGGTWWERVTLTAPSPHSS